MRKKESTTKEAHDRLYSEDSTEEERLTEELTQARIGFNRALLRVKEIESRLEAEREGTNLAQTNASTEISTKGKDSPSTNESNLTDPDIQKQEREESTTDASSRWPNSRQGK